MPCGRRQRRGWPRAFNRTLLIGDVTGDGRSDLLIEHTNTSLHVFVGVPDDPPCAPGYTHLEDRSPHY